jgi:hypothetical protein
MARVTIPGFGTSTFTIYNDEIGSAYDHCDAFVPWLETGRDRLFVQEIIEGHGPLLVYKGGTWQAGVLEQAASRVDRVKSVFTDDGRDPEGATGMMEAIDVLTGDGGLTVRLARPMGRVEYLYFYPYDQPEMGLLAGRGLLLEMAMHSLTAIAGVTRILFSMAGYELDDFVHFRRKAEAEIVDTMSILYGYCMENGRKDIEFWIYRRGLDLDGYPE